MFATPITETVTPPAGGAATGEIAIAALLVVAATCPLLWVIWRERVQGRGGEHGIGTAMSRWLGLPRWAAWPIVLTVASLLTAGFGVWWDVPIHLQDGRDEGPLANPSHYFILFGILGFFSAGVLSLTYRDDLLPRRTLRISPRWHAPLGGAVVTACGLMSLVGFPLDDLWHRLYGQDVTEWGPTHVLMIGGAVTCCLGITLLYGESRQLGARGASGERGRWITTIFLGLCSIPFAFLMEFDMGVPQFPAVTQFIIAGLLCGWIYVACRLWFGPGGALLGWAVYLVAHGFLVVSNLPMGHVLIGRFLLFLPAAVIVEAVALTLGTARVRRFATVSALLIGTVGLYAEWLWSKVFMPLPQPFPADSLPFLLSVGLMATLAGSFIGTWHVEQLQRTSGDDAPLGERPATWLRRHGLAAAGALTFLALMGVYAPPSADADLQARIDLSRPCDGTDACSAYVTATFTDPQAVEDAVWIYALHWQGRHTTDGPVPLDPATKTPGIMRVAMEPTGTPGQFRSAQELPFYGNGKTVLRVHLPPTDMVAIMLWAPDDPAIEGPGGRQVLVTSGQIADLTYEPQILQRERKPEVPTWLWATGYAVVLSIWVSLFAFYGWCYAAATRPREVAEELASTRGS
ncbi:MAG: hypothetical protein QM597_04195 [Aeromicrobium sp.]|uniref:hypothetical protein n=1 Tax=Aeromicrobium sp. TaxID=1871063 RepID=UPI0039E6AE54